ncbi:MAG: hypothetical protein ACOC1P_00285 [Minisyncoccales bacterium]
MSEKEPNFISLKEAAKHCQYSQEYLSLRARQGKLKAKKIGRNWATTKEWVKEYEKKMEAYKKGKKYEPEKEKKKKNKEEPKKKEKKVIKETKDISTEKRLVSLLSGIIIGIIISALIVNFLLIYSLSGFSFKNESIKTKKEANEFSYVVNNKVFNDLKVVSRKAEDIKKNFKEGLSYSGKTLEKIIVKNTYRLASKTGKINDKAQLAKVNFRKNQNKDKKAILNIKRSTRDFIASFVLYPGFLIKNSKKFLVKKYNLNQIIVEKDLDIHLKTIKFTASVSSIRKTTDLLEEYKNWLIKQIIN